MASARRGWWRLIMQGVAALVQLVLIVALWCSGESWWLPVWARLLWLVAVVALLLLTVVACIGKASGEQAAPK